MAESAIVSITDEAAVIATGGESSETHARIKVTGTDTIYLGGSDVTADDGYPVAATEAVVIQLAANEKLYACTVVDDPAVTSEVTVLTTSKGSIFAP